MQEKEELRKKYLKKRAEISNLKVKKWSKKINNKFLKLPNLKTAANIMAYASMKNEIKTFDLLNKLLKRGYNLYLPFTRKDIIDLGIAEINDLKKELKEGVFGVQEPIAKIRKTEFKHNFDLIIVPGLCFNKDGYRIGYGGGYYDSFLSKHAGDALKVGFSYDKFIVDSLPVEDHDIPVDLIITEEKIIKVD